MNTNTYYLHQSHKLLRGHREMMAIGESLLAEKQGVAFAKEAQSQAISEFERLIPEIPYIGGKKNPLTDTLIQMTSMLALYHALKAHIPLSEIGDLAYQMAVTWIESYPRQMRHLIGRYYMSGFMKRRKQKQAVVSQERQYQGDFVYEFVPGDGENFAWGINYLECAIVKFFQAQGAGEFAPYMCRIDFLMFPAMGITLKRSGTVAQGCDHCDFRFQWGGREAKAQSRGLLENES